MYLLWHTYNGIRVNRRQIFSFIYHFYQPLFLMVCLGCFIGLQRIRLANQFSFYPKTKPNPKHPPLPTLCCLFVQVKLFIFSTKIFSFICEFCLFFQVKLFIFSTKFFLFIYEFSGESFYLFIKNVYIYIYKKKQSSE